MLVKLYRNFTNGLLFHLHVNSFRWINTGKQLLSAGQEHTLEERKVNIDGMNINYLKVGTGEHPVLLLPGAAGSIWTDFKPQIEKLDRGKFTIVAWDPPGYGKSRPPNRIFSDNYFQKDAVSANDLMKVLGFTKFSLIGWSDGGITSLILAAMFPDNIRKMVTIAANAYITPEEVNIYKKFRSIDSWSEKMRAPLIAVYGEEYLRDTWSNWVDATLRIYKKQNGDLCKHLLSKIKCPTLVVQGNKDPVVLPEHSIYLRDHIVDAKLKIIENGAHNLHLRYSEEFNELVTKFLTE